MYIVRKTSDILKGVNIFIIGVIWDADIRSPKCYSPCKWTILYRASTCPKELRKGLLFFNRNNTIAYHTIDATGYLSTEEASYLSLFTHTSYGKIKIN